MEHFVESDSILHWTRFYPNIKRVHTDKAKDRQELVLYIASLWKHSQAKVTPNGLCSIKVPLTQLRENVRDYRAVIDHFFDVRQLGFRLEDSFELSTLTPRKLPEPEELEISSIVDELQYQVPARPDDAVISKVYLQDNIRWDMIFERLSRSPRPDIVLQLKWLQRQPSELNFHFKPVGKLGMRDTSVWPIRAIESWPSWLREELFGPSVDLDSAYVQFLVRLLEEALPRDRIELLFPDLLRLLNDKENFRRELCEEVLMVEYTKHHKSVMKTILMSLANGSKISPNMILNSAHHSVVAEMIIDMLPTASNDELVRIGERFHQINRQFDNARKMICVALFKKAPTLKNKKSVFSSYFTWERTARYMIWEQFDRHGLMAHDGLDGVPLKYLENLDQTMEELNLKLSVKGMAGATEATPAHTGHEE